MTSHLFENLVEVCEFDRSQLEIMKTYPNDPWVQLLLLKIDQEKSHELADLHFGWHVAEAAGGRRTRRILGKMMKSGLSVCFSGSEWRNRADEDKAAALLAAWQELDDLVRLQVQGIFRPRGGEYMVLLGWIVQATLAASVQSGEHDSCECSYSLAQANLGPRDLAARRDHPDE